MLVIIFHRMKKIRQKDLIAAHRSTYFAILMSTFKFGFSCYNSQKAYIFCIDYYCKYLLDIWLYLY